jgi:hypothetical protein
MAELEETAFGAPNQLKRAFGHRLSGPGKHACKLLLAQVKDRNQIAAPAHTAGVEALITTLHWVLWASVAGPLTTELQHEVNAAFHAAASSDDPTGKNCGSR